MASLPKGRSAGTRTTSHRGNIECGEGIYKVVGETPTTRNTTA